METKFVLFSKISENEKLINFCNRIIGYNNILAFEESRNIFIDTLSHIDGSDDAFEVLETIWFIDQNLNLMILEDIVIEFIKTKFLEIIKDIETKYPELLNKRGN